MEIDMNKPKDDYYYRLGRHMAVIEFNNKIPKLTQPSSLNVDQMAGWTRGYSEIAAKVDERTRTSRI